MQHLTNSRHRWLWIVLGLWLTLFQTAVAAHSIEEGIVSHHHGSCLLCHAGHLSGAAPTAAITLHFVAQRVITLSIELLLAPWVVVQRQQQARAPPAS
ncbi:hypothetical protein JYB87_10555 [Shewanella avicenniae]|uniref:DUF2946 domain-containing protein n=1 Tax=Shewanella avicenniae TaxID=2814294 RepID=A0ABX7QL96_9GAMM|nr:hypothetical protein [Shewanella avicenniae]QSX32222.1 hypothetical protein JYB87_10555 [Shewanella avicenniae]